MIRYRDGKTTGQTDQHIFPWSRLTPQPFASNKRTPDPRESSLFPRTVVASLGIVDCIHISAISNKFKLYRVQKYRVQNNISVSRT